MATTVHPAAIATPSAAALETREQWLRWGVDVMRPRFADGGYELPPVIHVSVGFPSRRALSIRKRAIGECFSGGSSDGAAHVFISPVLGSGVEALDTLVHELTHVVTPGSGHRAPFIKAGNAVGLTAGRPTSRGAGAELRDVLERLNAQSPFPHAALSPLAGGLRKQTTRMVKVACPECGYVCRVTRKWLVAAGAPHCPVHGEPLEETDAVDRVPMASCSHGEG
jgi:hypothetical protein